MDDSASDSSDNVQNERYVEAVTEKRKNKETGKEPPVVSETVVLYQRSFLPDFLLLQLLLFHQLRQIFGSHTPIYEFWI